MKCGTLAKFRRYIQRVDNRRRWQKPIYAKLGRKKKKEKKKEHSLEWQPTFCKIDYFGSSGCFFLVSRSCQVGNKTSADMFEARMKQTCLRLCPHIFLSLCLRRNFASFRIMCEQWDYMVPWSASSTGMFKTSFSDRIHQEWSRSSNINKRRHGSRSVLLSDVAFLAVGRTETPAKSTGKCECRCRRRGVPTSGCRSFRGQNGRLSRPQPGS